MTRKLIFPQDSGSRRAPVFVATFEGGAKTRVSVYHHRDRKGFDLAGAVKLSRAAFENRVRSRQRTKGAKPKAPYQAPDAPIEIPATTAGRFVDSDNGKTLKEYTVAQLEAAQ